LGTGELNGEVDLMGPGKTKHNHKL